MFITRFCKQYGTSVVNKTGVISEAYKAAMPEKAKSWFGFLDMHWALNGGVWMEST